MQEIGNKREKIGIKKIFELKKIKKFVFIDSFNQNCKQKQYFLIENSKGKFK